MSHSPDPPIVGAAPAPVGAASSPAGAVRAAAGAPAEPVLPVATKLTYGAGQITDTLGLNGVKQIGNQFYVVLLGVSPAWVGLVLALIRLWDAMIDPLVGAYSDRLQSRWGRRKPLILAGAAGMALLFPLLWAAQPGWGDGAKVIWFTGVLMVFYIAYATFSVPFQALGLELASGYHQRTSVQAFRTFFGASSNLIIWWALPLAFWPVFGGAHRGMLWVGTMIGLLIGVCGLLPLRLRLTDDAGKAGRGRSRQDRREHHDANGGGGTGVPGEARSLATAPPTAAAGWRTVIGNRSFRWLLGAVGLTFLGVNMTYGVSGLLNVYFIFEGNIAASMAVTGAYGTLWTAASLAATPLVPRLSRLAGKRAVLAVCVASVLSGSLLQLRVFVPAHPWLQLLPVPFLSAGMAGLWILGPSMLADVCDEDRLRHGLRREATYAAVYSWVQKLALSASFALSGWLTVLAGFDVARAAAQTPGVFDALRRLLAFGPLAVLLPALFCALRFPVTEAVARQNRARLEQTAAG
jgi:GPH family glycoside/pentoside/hexuronide:cation symporter